MTSISYKSSPIASTSTLPSATSKRNQLILEEMNSRSREVLNNNYNLTTTVTNNNNKSLETRRGSETSNTSHISSIDSLNNNANSSITSSHSDLTECNCGNKHLTDLLDSLSPSAHPLPTLNPSTSSNAMQLDEQPQSEVSVEDTIMKDQVTLKKEEVLGKSIAASSTKNDLVLSLSAGGSINSSSSKSNDFNRFGLPTAAQLLAASECKVIGESGQSIQFSQLIHQRGRVVVVFLRHLWCGLCQQYVTALQSLSSSLPSSSSNLLSTPSNSNSQIPPLYILLISSGSPSLIPIYRKRLNCPFPLYVDQSRSLYKFLGMTRKSWDAGSNSSSSNPSSPTGVESERHTSWPGTAAGGGDRSISSYAANGMIRNVKGSMSSAFSMSLKSGGANPGSQRQLGGEFVLESRDNGERIECTYASRMSNTRNHSEVRELFAAAGVDLRPLPSDQEF